MRRVSLFATMGKSSARRISLRLKVSMLIGSVCALVYLYIGLRPNREPTKEIEFVLKQRSMHGYSKSRDISEPHLEQFKTSEQSDTILIPGTNNTDKVRHIGFLKVHKAASSTMQNMFFRFGLKHGLTFVLPVKNNYLKQHTSILPIKNGSHYDILALHTTYSKQRFGSLLPVNSVKIGIVREPLDRMISAAYYYRYKFHRKYLKKVPEATFITSLVNNPEKFDASQFSYTKNAMGSDFGFSPNLTGSDVTEIQKHLDLIKKEFKLVMLSDKFEESLILMKRYLNWELSDILFVEVNSNSHHLVKRQTLNLKKFRQTCFLDYIIYDAFSDILKEKITQEGPVFKEEVSHFKSVLKKLNEFCVELKKDDSMVVPTSKWNDKFEVDKGECNVMMRSENDMLADLRKIHKAMNEL